MKDFNVIYTNATVIHSNKYNQNTGLVISFLFFSNFFQDVIFKSDENGDEFPITFKNLNLPLHTGQKVTLISLDDKIIAYIDKATNEFHYLSNNLQRDLDYGFSINWRTVLVLTFLVFILLSILSTPWFSYSPLILILPIGLWFYQRITNFVLERKIDKLIITG